jgi:hypothetical protein
MKKVVLSLCLLIIVLFVAGCAQTSVNDMVILEEDVEVLPIADESLKPGSEPGPEILGEEEFPEGTVHGEPVVEEAEMHVEE